MSEIDIKYFECPICSYDISFNLDNDHNKYTSTCLQCGNVLEIEKNDYESDTEVYFEKDF